MGRVNMTCTGKRKHILPKEGRDTTDRCGGRKEGNNMPHTCPANPLQRIVCGWVRSQGVRIYEESCFT